MFGLSKRPAQLEPAHGVQSPALHEDERNVGSPGGEAQSDVEALLRKRTDERDVLPPRLDLVAVASHERRNDLRDQAELRGKAAREVSGRRQVAHVGARPDSPTESSERGVAQIDGARQAERRQPVSQGERATRLKHGDVGAHPVDDLAGGDLRAARPEDGVAERLVADVAVSPSQQRSRVASRRDGRSRQRGAEDADLHAQLAQGEAEIVRAGFGATDMVGRIGVVGGKEHPHLRRSPRATARNAV